jgi:hypothetical protein
MRKPVIYFAFNRPDKIRQTLLPIIEYGPKKIYCFIDGPRDGNDNDVRLIAESVKQILDIVPSGMSIDMNQSRVNLGSRLNILKGVKIVAGLEDCFIVVEDDVKLNQDAFRFLEMSLDWIKDKKNIVSVTAYRPIDECPGIQLSKHFSCWGWAIWSSMFINIESKMSVIPESKSVEKRLKNQDDGCWLYPVIWKKTLCSKKFKSWDYSFRSAMLMDDENHLVLYPPCNLVVNVGFDRYATRTKFGASNTVKTLDREFHGSFPETLERNVKFDILLDSRHYYIGYRKLISILLLEHFPYPHSILKRLFYPR